MTTRGVHVGEPAHDLSLILLHLAQGWGLPEWATDHILRKDEERVHALTNNQAGALAAVRYIFYQDDDRALVLRWLRANLRDLMGAWGTREESEFLSDHYIAMYLQNALAIRAKAISRRDKEVLYPADLLARQLVALVRLVAVPGSEPRVAIGVGCRCSKGSAKALAHDAIVAILAAAEGRESTLHDLERVIRTPAVYLGGYLLTEEAPGGWARPWTLPEIFGEILATRPRIALQTFQWSGGEEGYDAGIVGSMRCVEFARGHAQSVSVSRNGRWSRWDDEEATSEEDDPWVLRIDAAGPHLARAPEGWERPVTDRQDPPPVREEAPTEDPSQEDPLPRWRVEGWLQDGGAPPWALRFIPEILWQAQQMERGIVEAEGRMVEAARLLRKRGKKEG